MLREGLVFVCSSTAAWQTGRTAAERPASERDRQSHPVIIADVDISEWAPPMSLTLDTRSGQYPVAPPAGPWPVVVPKPKHGRGILPGERLDGVRAAVRKTLLTWAAGHGARSDKNCRCFGSNAGIARLTNQVERRKGLRWPTLDATRG